MANLASAFRWFDERATDWDRLELESYRAFMNGEHSRTVALAKELVRRYPRDPRAFAKLARAYSHQGRWQDAEGVLIEELALDSLATEAGSGACVPCGVFPGIAELRLTRGDLAGAVQAAQRWVAVQPDLPGAWITLSSTLSYAGRYDAALGAARRSIALSDGEPDYLAQFGRLLLMMRRYDSADSAIAAWAASPSPHIRKMAFDLRFTAERERGQYRASNRTIEAMLRAFPQGRELELVRGNNLGRIGDYAGALRLYERLAHTTNPEVLPTGRLTAVGARGFSWHHSLEGDAIAASGDTVRLRILADSIEMVGARSYYGRDWRLPHHLRGLIAMRGGRYADAVRELEAARWGMAGWTRTLAELAWAHLALGHPRNAIAALRNAYASPLDAMGRYLPHSEIDYLMALSFRSAGRLDSAAVYTGYVRRAWRNADPEAKRMLASLAWSPTAPGAP